MSRPKYTCHGPLSGSCGETHNTMHGAEKCCEEHFARTGRTDRSVHSATGPNAPKRKPKESVLIAVLEIVRDAAKEQAS